MLIKFLLKLYSPPKYILDTLNIGLLATSGAGGKSNEIPHLEGHFCLHLWSHKKKKKG